jgi:hypothetical protein
MKNRISLFASILILSTVMIHGQTFEGSITFRASGDHEKTSTIIIKGEKSVRSVDLNSEESLKIILDRKSESSVMLRKKDEKKYGFRVNEIHEQDHEDHPYMPKGVTTEITGEKMIGRYECFRVNLKSKNASAEAWITKDIGFRVTKYFPEFLGSVEAELHQLRQLANDQGLILQYRETLLDAEYENVFETIVEETEIPDQTFEIDPDYLVLDKDGMMQLYLAAQHDTSKKQQWEEFMELFGNK